PEAKTRPVRAGHALTREPGQAATGSVAPRRPQRFADQLAGSLISPRDQWCRDFKLPSVRFCAEDSVGPVDRGPKVEDSRWYNFAAMRGRDPGHSSDVSAASCSPAPAGPPVERPTRAKDLFHVVTPHDAFATLSAHLPSGPRRERVPTTEALGR